MRAWAGACSVKALHKRLCRARVAPGRSPLNTAWRASSWRNDNRPGLARCSRPLSTLPSMASWPSSPSKASSKCSSSATGLTLTSSSTVRTLASSRAVRDQTASRTEAGKWPGSRLQSVSSSDRKKGLPPVTRYNSEGSQSASRASVATASGDNGGRSKRWVVAGGKSPAQRQKAWSGGSSSLRALASNMMCWSAMRRARYLSRSSVAWSAQCKSSHITSTGRACAARCPSSIGIRMSGLPALSMVETTSGPRAGAKSRRGPSTRGVDRSSHAPCRIKNSPFSVAAKACSRDDLPMPASPSTSAIPPAPELTRLASRCKSCNCLSRSSSIWLSSLPSYSCQRKRILTNRNVRQNLYEAVSL